MEEVAQVEEVAVVVEVKEMQEDGLAQLAILLEGVDQTLHQVNRWILGGGLDHVTVEFTYS